MLIEHQRMRCPKWVTAQDLDRWAATPPSKLLLPELLRRLVRATVPADHLKKLDFPSEAEVHRPGYDGTTVTTKGTLYVPEGVGLWELGCEVGNARGKADRDYEKRIEEHEEKAKAGDAEDIGQPEGNVDLTTLRQWVTETRRLATEADRIAVCDIHIGQVFARSNEDESDKAKPVIPIREVIEECESDEMGRGFAIGLHNLRGTFSKGMYEGGEQERELAARYNRYADACARWPRTAAVILSVAEGYLQAAEREDERAKARE
jgi:hypothetical protein